MANMLPHETTAEQDIWRPSYRRYIELPDEAVNFDSLREISDELPSPRKSWHYQTLAWCATEMMMHARSAEEVQTNYERALLHCNQFYEYYAASDEKHSADRLKIMARNIDVQRLEAFLPFFEFTATSSIRGEPLGSTERRHQLGTRAVRRINSEICTPLLRAYLEHGPSFLKGPFKKNIMVALSELTVIQLLNFDQSFAQGPIAVPSPMRKELGRGKYDVWLCSPSDAIALAIGYSFTQAPRRGIVPVVPLNYAPKNGRSDLQLLFALQRSMFRSGSSNGDETLLHEAQEMMTYDIFRYEAVHNRGKTEIQ